MPRQLVGLSIIAVLAVVVATIGSLSARHSSAQDPPAPQPAASPAQFDPGFPSEAELIRRFGTSSDFRVLYVEPSTVDVAPELGGPPPGRMVATRRYMVAKWRLDALVEALGDGSLTKQTRELEKRLKRVSQEFVARRWEREPKAGDAGFEAYDRLRQDKELVSRDLANRNKTMWRLLAEYDLIPTYQSFLSNLPNAAAVWEAALSQRPDLAEAWRDYKALDSRLKAIDEQMSDILTEHGRRPLCTPEERAEQNRLVDELRHLKARREDIRQLPPVTAARYELWRICHEEYQKQQVGFPEFMRLARAQGLDVDEPVLRLHYERALWKNERPVHPSSE